ncbi:MAG: hypothetical protein ABW156_04490 [Jiangellaceae bacterium]
MSQRLGTSTRRPSAALCLGIVLAMSALVSCGLNQQTEDAVNDAVADIDPANFGHVISDESTGSGRPPGQLPTRITVFVVDADADDVTATLEAALAAAGFENTGGDEWTRGDTDGAGVSVLLTVVPPEGPATAGVEPHPPDTTVRMAVHRHLSEDTVPYDSHMSGG